MGCNVKEWLKYNSNHDDISKLFYNMSFTMKYIHNNNYYIKSFDMSQINIVDEDVLSPIEYKSIEKIVTDSDQVNISNNIHILALMQLGAYSNTLDYFNSKFAEDNFNEFEIFIPENDIPYLRGAVQRKSPVYYCDFVDARNKREIEKMEKEAGGFNSAVGGLTKSKSTAIGRAMSDKENERLYKNKFDDSQAAFTTFLILPLTLILLGIILSIVTLLVS